MNKFSVSVLVGTILLCSITADAETNQFVMRLNSEWTSKSASTVLGFIENELTSRPNDPQVLFARAVAAAELEQWCRGATNYCSRAIDVIRQETNYTAEDKRILLSELSGHLKFFTTTIATFKEPADSIPQTNALIQAEMFRSCPDEFPYTKFLSTFNSHE